MRPRYVSTSMLFAILLSPQLCNDQITEHTAGNRVAVVVLGNAQDAGYPQAGCNQSCCLPAWKSPEKRRMASCLAVIDFAAGKRILLDCTPNFPEQLRLLDEQCLKLGYYKNQIPAKTKPDGIFLTHAHIGHYTGLMHLGREAMGNSATDVWAMPRMKQFLQSNGPWSQLVELDNIQLQNLKRDTLVNASPQIAVTPIKVPHRDEFSETVGFKVVGPNRSMLYLPDIDKWSRWDASINELIKTVDVAYLDGTFLENGEIPGRDMSTIPHPFISESIRQFSSLEKKDRAKIRFIHLNHTNPALQQTGKARKMIERAGMRVAEQAESIDL